MKTWKSVQKIKKSQKICEISDFRCDVVQGLRPCGMLCDVGWQLFTDVCFFFFIVVYEINSISNSHTHFLIPGHSAFVDIPLGYTEMPVASLPRTCDYSYAWSRQATNQAAERQEYPSSADTYLPRELKQLAGLTDFQCCHSSHDKTELLSRNNIEIRSTQIFQKYRSQLKILGDRRAIWSQFRV